MIKYNKTKERYYLQAAVGTMDVPHVEVFGVGILVASTHALLRTIRILILWDNNLLKFIKLKTILFITVSQSNLLKLCHITTRLNEIKYALTIRHKMLPHLHVYAVESKVASKS